MREEGFKLQTQFANSVDEARGYLGESIYGDHVDLVLMDYHLAGSAEGDDGLVAVREIFPYKDIVFYSAKSSAELKSLVMQREISGVFCSTRADLPDTVLGVFGVLVKKVLDIDHSRGIVMGATSEIDAFINRSLQALLSNGGPEANAKALGIVKEQLAKLRESFERECRKLEGLTDATGLQEFHLYYTSAKRLFLLRQLVGSTEGRESDVQPMIAYENETVPKRNTLAHVTVERSGFSRRIIAKNGKELSVQYMRDLRLELLNHHEWFEKLAISFEAS
jgi:hypothetical protein